MQVLWSRKKRDERKLTIAIQIIAETAIRKLSNITHYTVMRCHTIIWSETVDEKDTS